MTRREELARDVVDCPFCHRRKGDNCISRGSVGICLVKPHAARMLRADRNYFREGEMARVRPVVHFTEKETRYADRTYNTILGIDPPDGFAIAKVEPGHYTLLENIETGFGNDDRLMEKALDMEDPNYYEPGEPYTPEQDLAVQQEAFDLDLLFQGPEALIVRGTKTGRTEVSRKKVLENQLDRIMNEIDKLEALGEDVYEDDTVLYIKYKHTEEQEMVYSYVAFKTGGRWYVTGYQNEGPRSWSKLVEFFSHGIVTEMWMAEGWEQII